MVLDVATITYKTIANPIFKITNKKCIKNLLLTCQNHLFNNENFKVFIIVYYLFIKTDSSLVVSPVNTTSLCYTAGIKF